MKIESGFYWVQITGHVEPTIAAFGAESWWRCGSEDCPNPEDVQVLAGPIRRPGASGIAGRIRVNDRIDAPEVRVISADGRMLGVLQAHEALRMAEDQGLDLVEINPKADPPVCKILDCVTWERKKDLNDNLAATQARCTALLDESRAKGREIKRLQADLEVMSRDRESLREALAEAARAYVAAVARPHEFKP
jgi:Translation initiation factor IF-3, N-terminal domain